MDEYNEAITKVLEYINDIIGRKSCVLSSPKLSKLVLCLSQMLHQTDQAIHTSVTLKGKFCLFCHTYISSESLTSSLYLLCNPTAHIVCSTPCFRKYCLSNSDPNLLDLSRVRCPQCNTPLDEQQINECFNGKLKDLQADAHDRALLNLLDEEAKAALRPKKICEICYTEFLVDEGITLGCDHRFCMPCIKQYIEMLIESAQVSEKHMKCPNCPQALHTYEVEEVVSEELYDKYQKFRLRALKLEEEDQKDILFHCNGADCEYMCIVERGAAEFECPSCNHKCCPACREDVHKGISCEEFRTWKIENSEADKKFEDMIKERGWMRCPECGCAIQRIDGCQYMICGSSRCQNQTYLCYLCGKKLEQDHGAHKCTLRDEVKGKVDDYEETNDGQSDFDEW